MLVRLTRVDRCIFVLLVGIFHYMNDVGFPNARCEKPCSGVTVSLCPSVPPVGIEPTITA